MTQETLPGSGFSLNGHSPFREEWENSLHIFPQSKREAREYLDSVPMAIKLIDLPRIGVDLASAGQDALGLIGHRDFWVKRDIQGKKPLVIYAGGFGTNEVMAEAPMRYFKNRGYDVEFYRYRAEKYPNRKRAPAYLQGANVEPLEWQLDDFVDFCLEKSAEYDQELALEGESKGGLLLKLAILFSGKLRRITKVANTGGSPGPVIQNINTFVLGRYVEWLDYFDADDLGFTRLLTPFVASRLEQHGLSSAENDQDRIMGPGIQLGNVYKTSIAHMAFFRNKWFLSFSAGQIDDAFGVRERESKVSQIDPRPIPWRFPYNPLLA